MIDKLTKIKIWIVLFAIAIGIILISVRLGLNRKVVVAWGENSQTKFADSVQYSAEYEEALKAKETTK